MDGIQVAIHALGKGAGAAHPAAQPGAQGAKAALGVVGLSLLLAAETARARRESSLVGQASRRGASPDAGSPGGTCARKLLAPALAAVAEGVGHDLAGAAAKRQPPPDFPRLGGRETPEFIQFQHVAFFAGQERVLKGRQAPEFLPPPSASASGSTPPERLLGCRACSADPRRPQASGP